MHNNNNKDNRNNNNNRNSKKFEKKEVPEFNETMLALDRVTRVVKGGRRFRFRAAMIIGDGKGRVGFGIAKGNDVAVAIQKAVSNAKKNMLTVEIQGNTVSHDLLATKDGAKILIKPASPGTGIIAGGTTRIVLEAVGIKDCLSKSMGSSNKINTAYATLDALKSMRKITNPKAIRFKQIAEYEKSQEQLSAVIVDDIAETKREEEAKA